MGLHCLPLSQKWDARLTWVNVVTTDLGSCSSTNSNNDGRVKLNCFTVPPVAPLTERLQGRLTLASSHRCGFEPSLGHMCDRSSSAVVRCFFSGISRFSSHLMIVLAQKKRNTLNGQHKKKKKKKKKKEQKSLPHHNCKI